MKSSRLFALVAAFTSAVLVAPAVAANVGGASSGLSTADAVAVATEMSLIIPSSSVYTVENSGLDKPLYEDNALLLVEPTRCADLQQGDVVMVADATTGAVVAHRLINQVGEGWVAELSGRGMLVTNQNLRGRVYGVLYTSRTAAIGAGAGFNGRG